jgi:hypothetical protein
MQKSGREMQNNHLHYLEAMGIQAWMRRDLTQESASEPVSANFTAYELLNLAGEPCGYLVLADNTTNASALDDTASDDLLNAMLAAVSLRRSSTNLSQVEIDGMKNNHPSWCKFLLIMGETRNRFSVPISIPTIQIHHPAHLLQFPQDKRQAWQELKKIIAL